MKCIVRKLRSRAYVQRDGQLTTRIEEAAEFANRSSAMAFCREHAIKDALVVVRIGQPENDTKPEPKETSADHMPHY